MADQHEVVFQWPHSEPNTVIVTGTFDDWAKEKHLEKDATGFRGSVRIGWNEKIAYKFIVDGEWMLLEGEPTEADVAGNLNNIYTAPPLPDVIPKTTTPATQELPTKPSSATNSTLDNPHTINPESLPPLQENMSNTAEDVPEQSPDSRLTPTGDDETDAVADSVPEQSEHAVTHKPDLREDNEPAPAGDTADTDEAVVSKSKQDEHITSENHASSHPEAVPSEVAPHVPISIVPVNAPENNTVPSENTPSEVTPPFEESQAPDVETTQPPVTAVDSAAPSPSTHGVVAPASGAPVVGEIDSRNEEPSPVPNASGLDATSAHPEPESVHLPPSTSSEAPISTEPTTTGSDTTKTNEPRENGTHTKDGEPLCSTTENHASGGDFVPPPPPTHSAVVEDRPGTEAKEKPTATPPHNDGTPLEQTKETSSVSPHDKEISEEVPNHTTVSTQKEAADLGSTPAMADATPAPAAPTSDTEHNHIDSMTPSDTQVNKEPTSAGERDKGDGGVVAVAEPTKKADELPEEVASTSPKPIDPENEPTPTTVAPIDPVIQSAQGPVTEAVNGSASPSGAENTTTNGHTAIAETPPVTESVKPSAAASPSTPTKNVKHSFPSSSPSASPSSSKFNTDGSRKKRTSFISKVKHLFTHDKDKDKDKK